MKTHEFVAGGYRFIGGVFQYSAGVIALDGHEIVRVRFRRPVPLVAGFDRIEKYLREVRRPLTSFCACELRSPAPFSEAGFKTFNEYYVGVLDRWRVLHDGKNPVARTNVCPEFAPPSEPMFHAFCYTRLADVTAPSFVIAGSGEVPEGRNNYRDYIVRFGETSSGALREKALFVLDAMERRLAALESSWEDTTNTQIYTIHDVYPFLSHDLVKCGAARLGFTWHFDRPPVVGLEYEMYCRAISVELVI